MESLPAQLSWKRCKCLQSSLFQSKIYQHDQIQRRYRTIFTTHYACRNADVNLICLQQRLTDSFFQTSDSLMKSMRVRLTWLDCNLPITYLSIRQSMPCLMCKPLEHIWLISFVFGQFVIIIQTNCFRVSLKIRQAASWTIKLFFNIFYDDSTQCVKMMKQNSVCLRFRFIFALLPNVTGVYTLLGYTRSRLLGSWLYTLQFIARWWKKEKRKLYKWPTVCVYNGSSLSFVDSYSWQTRLDLLADWVILFADFTTKYQCELLTFWEASSNTSHCVLSDNPKKTSNLF